MSSLAESEVSSYGMDKARKRGRQETPVTVHTVGASTSSAATSKLVLDTDQERDEDGVLLSPKDSEPPVYRLYKRRWIGVAALVSRL